MIAALLSALHSSQSSSVSFNLAVFKKDFCLKNILKYLWCDLALLVDSKQEMWYKFHSLIPLKVWNCNKPMIYGKMQSHRMKAGTLEENAKLNPCVLL